MIIQTPVSGYDLLLLSTHPGLGHLTIYPKMLTSHAATLLPYINHILKD